MTKRNKIITDDSWAVDIDYEGLPIIEQVEGKVMGAIRRINPAVLNIMKVFSMEHVSQYCTNVNSIGDLCNIYRSSSRSNTNEDSNRPNMMQSSTVDTNEIITRLSNLALDFNSGNGTKI